MAGGREIRRLPRICLGWHLGYLQLPMLWCGSEENWTDYLPQKRARKTGAGALLHGSYAAGSLAVMILSCYGGGLGYYLQNTLHTCYVTEALLL